MPYYKIAISLSRACLATNKVPADDKSIDKYRKILTSTDTWHVYGVQHGHQLCCIKSHSKGEARLFFFLNPTTGLITLLGYFQVSKNEHSQYAHVRKIYPAFSVFAAAKDQAQSTLPLLSEKSEKSPKQEAVSYPKEQPARWQQAVDNIDLSLMTRKQIVAVFNLYFQLVTSGLDGSKPISQVLKKIQTILQSPQVKLYFGLVKQRVSLFVKLGDSAYQAVELSAINGLEAATRELLQMPFFVQQRYRSIQVDPQVILSDFDSPNWVLRADEANLLVNLLIEKAFSGELDYARLFEAIAKIAQRMSKGAMISAANTDQIIEFIDIYLVMQAHTDGVKNNLGVLDKKQIYVVLKACKASLKTRHVSTLLKLDPEVIAPQDVVELLSCIEGGYRVENFSAILVWCESTDQKNSTACKTILEQLLAEYEKLSLQEKMAIYPTLEKYAVMLENLSLNLPEKPILPPAEVPASSSSHQHQRKRPLRVIPSPEKTTIKDIISLAVKHAGGIKDPLAVAEEFAKLIAHRDRHDETFIEQMTKLYIDKTTFKLGEDSYNLFELACYANCSRLLLLLEDVVDTKKLSGHYTRGLKIALSQQSLAVIFLLIHRFQCDVSTVEQPFGRLFKKNYDEQRPIDTRQLINVIGLLMQKGADINQPCSKTGETPVMMALSYPLAVIKCLLEQGADVSTYMTMGDNKEVSVLDRLVGLPQVSSGKIKYLKKAGATHRSGPTTLNNDSIYRIDFCSDNLESRLFPLASTCVEQDRFELIALYSILMEWLDMYKNKQPHRIKEKVEKHLEQYPYHLNQLMTISRDAVHGNRRVEMKLSVLGLLMLVEELELAKKLLMTYPVSLNLILNFVGFSNFSSHQEPILYLAMRYAKRKDNRFAMMLLDFGAAIDVINKPGRQAIHVAIEANNVEMFKLLYSMRKTQPLTRNGDNLLHMAAAFGKKKLIEVVFSTLTFAEVIRQLQERNENGHTPISISKLHGNKSFIDVINCSIQSKCMNGDIDESLELLKGFSAEAKPEEQVQFQIYGTLLKAIKDNNATNIPKFVVPEIINMKNIDGDTLLHIACHGPASNAGVVLCLANLLCTSLLVTNHYGQTPVDCYRAMAGAAPEYQDTLKKLEEIAVKQQLSQQCSQSHSSRMAVPTFRSV